VAAKVAPPGSRLRLRWGLASLLSVGLLLVPSARARAQGTWIIDSFSSDITVQSDGTLAVAETIAVDFSAPQHGIYREIPVTYDYSSTQVRVLQVDVGQATDQSGNAVEVKTSRVGANLQLRLGDPNRTVTGRQTYHLEYHVRGALNAFPDHDELYWNATGDQWSVPMTVASVTVAVPAGSLQQVACYQGPQGSTQTCSATRLDASTAQFAATRQLSPGEGLTVVVGMAKGAVPEPVPILSSKPRTPLQYFSLGPGPLLASFLVLLGGLLLVGRAWWRHGRDRRYTSLYYLTQNPAEETRPIGGRDEIVVEYQPPEGLRPAEIGLLLDERADAKDVTATIIHLAVRGYLTITEVAQGGLMGRLAGKDWLLTRKKEDASDLAKYERLAFDGLFESGPEVRLSDLKREYYATLSIVADELYFSATERGWFSGNPQSTRNKWLAAGMGVVVAGVALCAALGYLAGFGLVGVPVALVGLVMIPLSRAMASRTAQGSELLRRCLGFREYMVTAEKDRQRFFEAAHLFSDYLPYAIVFGCVQRWAKAFEGIEGATAATAGWYVGGYYGGPLAFSSALEGLNSNVTSAIASTPSASGASGFGAGGFSGGGMGGGGGGAW
jgi:hypothetical protein